MVFTTSTAIAQKLKWTARTWGDLIEKKLLTRISAVVEAQKVIYKEATETSFPFNDYYLRKWGTREGGGWGTFSREMLLRPVRCGTPSRWGNPPSCGRKIKRVYLQSYSPGVVGWGFLGLLLRLQLRSLSRGVPSSHLEKDERLILRHVCIYSWKRHALCYAVFGYARNRWLNTLNGIVWEAKYGWFTTPNIPKCENFTLLVCPLGFLVISAMRRLGNAQSFKTYMLCLWAFCHEPYPG